jgi:hypothetical protein
VGRLRRARRPADRPGLRSLEATGDELPAVAAETAIALARVQTGAPMGVPARPAVRRSGASTVLVELLGIPAVEVSGE